MPHLTDLLRPPHETADGLTVRSRVLQRIDGAATRPITLLVAPAGYGKSVALSHWLQMQSARQVRFDVRPEHGTLLGFTRGFADALRSGFPALRETVSTAHQSSAGSRSAGADLARWMNAHLEAFEGIIAVDDLQWAAGDPEIPKFLDALIRCTKEHIRWIIASRSTIDLPIASWLAYRDMDSIVSERDLVFSIDEARALASQSNRSFREDEFQAVFDATAGWAVALGFAVRNIPASAGVRSINAETREMLFEYIAEQVYVDLAPAERRLLHFASYLPVIDVSVLEAAGFWNANALLTDLRRRVTFIGATGEEFTCHDLFREFLRRQLEVGDPAEAGRLQTQAACILEQTGNFAAALRLFLRLRDRDETLRILEQHGFALLDRSHGDAVLEAITLLTDDARTHPVLLGLRAQHEADAGHYDRAEALFRAASDVASDRHLSAMLRVRLAVVLRIQGRDAAELLEPLRAQDLPLAIHGEVVSLLAINYASAGKHAEAQIAIEHAEAAAAGVESDSVRAKILHRIGTALFEMGAPAEDVITVEMEAAAIAERLGMLSIASRAYANVGGVALYHNDDVESNELFVEKSRALAAKSGNVFSYHSALLFRLDHEIERGNKDAVHLLLDSLARGPRSDTRVRVILGAQAHLLAWESCFEDAAAKMDLYARLGYGFYDYDVAFDLALHALINVAAKRTDRSVDLLHTALSCSRKSAPRYSFGVRRLEFARLICAASEIFSGNLSHGAKLLKNVNGEISGVRQMRDAVHQLMMDLTGQSQAGDTCLALEQLTVSGYGGIARVLSNCAATGRWKGQASQSYLTPSEVQVLRLLESGLPPKDIASETGRSVHTVRTLIQRAIDRLGCNGRGEALAIARELSVL